jgi:PAS domain S-box-containing protein
LHFRLKRFDVRQLPVRRKTPVTITHPLPGIDLSHYLLEPIRGRQDSAFVVLRGHRTAPSGHPASVLVIMPTEEHPRADCVQMLEHEYALRADLDASWAVLPLALANYQGRTCLVLDDPGGELLARTLGMPMDIGLFLRLGVSLAVALSELHRRGIIHKDLTPAHVIIDEAIGHVWLTGFRIASRLRRERQTPEPPEVIAGTLAYMAPEQTGRMNRSIDSRTDLYTLGVMLYEMLTGTLPFTARDPMEWVHCHVARQPVPPAERVPGVPPALSEIIMRLLAKAAEHRYQTAAGVGRDLQRCLTQWEAEQEIAPFRLAEHDTSDRLLIPERLYGRERETEILLAAFDRVVKTGAPELVFVSGYSGIGKSSVINELQKSLIPPRGLFASGKFDQGKRGIPYATLAQALQSLIRRVLAQSDADLAVWRAAFSEALGPNGRLIEDVVPELKLIIGEQPPAPDVPPQEARRRFQVVLERFIQVFARPERPLALFLDDLQWLDAATLDFIEALIRGDVRHLLIIGAYRDNELAPDHPLMGKLQAVRDAGMVVHEIALGPLTREHVAQLVADTLNSQPDHAAPLAQLVWAKAAGNPFFTTQFLTALADEGMLTFDDAHARWSWDVAAIRAMRYTDNVADLMFDRLTRLPLNTRRAVQSLACLGHSADVATLALVLGTTVDDAHGELWEAVRSELVARSRGSYRFLHDRVQEAAYALVPERDRSREHLRIGRLLVAHTPLERREETIFEIVHQLNRGATLIMSSDEREQLARLNLLAGKRAKASAAHAAALEYFTAGARLLPDAAWERHVELTFALEVNRAECEFVTGDLASAEERFAMVAARATHLVDEASVACLRIPLYTVLGRHERAVQIALSYLSKAGIACSPHPTNEEVREEQERLWQQIGSRPIESLFDLPLMSDPEIRGTMEVLSELLGPAYWLDQNLMDLLLLRMANLSIQYGNADASAVAFGYLGAVLGARFGRYADGYRFGLLGVDLVDKKRLDRAKPRVYQNVATWVVPWVRHLREAGPLLRRAQDAAERWRPLPYYLMWAYSSLVAHGLASGDPLGDVQRDAEEARRRVPPRSHRTGAVLDVMTGQLGLIRTLRGETRVFGSFADEEIDEQLLDQHLQDEPALSPAACRYWIRKLQAHVYSADHSRAADAATKAGRFLSTVSHHFLEAEYHFYSALAQAAAADSAIPEHRQELLANAASSHQKLVKWSVSCPENFDSSAGLVGAELARLDRRELDAERLYEQAIRSARQNGFVHIEGLAHELAGRFYEARGFETSARAHLREAHDCYLRWGAEGKLRQLEQLYPYLRPPERVTDSHAAISARVQHLDLATVLEGLQAVSAEIVLERLIDSLLRRAIEHAGAERGVLIETSAGGLLIQAEASVSRGTIAVCLNGKPVGADDLPESVIQYVARTQETVILNDASVSNPYSSDRYIRRTHARSILCLPLVKQGRLTAVLYLENHLAPGVFTPERIAVLQVLAPQAAMSLENSRLYRELELREAKIRRLVDASIVGIVIMRVDGTVSDANDAALEIVGFTRDDVRSGRVSWRDLTPPEWQGASDQAVAQLRATGSFDVFEKELFRKDGSRVPVLLAGTAVDETRQESVVFVIDLTERKRAEQETLEARVSERTRIARELHDTLLQSLQALLLKFHSAMNVLPSHPAEARRRLEKALVQAEGAITEGRNAVQGLRASVTTVNDLANDIAALGAELPGDPAGVNPPAVEVDVAGPSRDLNPIVRAEAFRIAGEALHNAFKHAQAQRIIVTIHYEALEFRLTARDDGKGMDPQTLARPQAAGHFGLPGMRERASIVKGQLAVRSAPGGGTEIELRVPAAIAYGPSGRRSRWSGFAN